MSYRGGSGNTSSQAAFKRILNDIRSNKTEVKLNGLETIAEQIAFSDASTLRGFPVQEACKEFIKIIQSSNDMAVLTLTTQCIVNLLDSIPDSSRQLSNLNYIQIAKEKLQCDLPKGVLENIIHSLCCLTKTKAREIGQTLGVKFILKNLDKLSGVEKHYAVAAMSRFTSYYATAKFAQSLPTIVNYFTSEDEQIVNNMIQTFTNILNAVGFSDIPKETIEIMCVSLSVISNSKIILQILSLLQRLIFNKDFCQILIETNLNYENYLTNTDFGNDFPKIRLITMQIIRSLLPAPDFPPNYWESEHPVPSNCEKLAKEVQPTLINLALQKSSDLNYVYANLAMSLKVYSSAVPTQLYQILIGSSQDIKLAPFVLLLALNLPDKNLVNSSGLTAHLSKVKIGPAVNHQEGEVVAITNINQWYRHYVNILKSITGLNRTKFAKPSSFKKFNDIFEFVNTSTMSPFELKAGGYIERLLELMRMEGGKVSSFDFSHIRDILHQIITYSNIPELIDPFESLSSREIANGSIIADIKYNNKTYKNKKFENESLFIAIEAWYNETINHVTTNDMLDAARASGRLGQMVSLEHAQNITYTHIGILHRAFGTKNYMRYSFKMNNKKYNVCDNLFQSIARSLPSPENWPIVTPSIELVEEDTSPNSILMSPLEVPKNNVPNREAFELLSLIHFYSKELDLYSIEFEKALFPHLMSFFLDVGAFSPAVQIAVNYPFLFSFEFRSFVLRVIAPDFFSALSIAQKPIFNSTEKLRDGRMFNHCTVSRSNLFEDGVLLMNSIAKGPLQLDICFENEAGFGVGPTKEFFSLLAVEFTRNRTKMWRTDNAAPAKATPAKVTPAQVRSEPVGESRGRKGKGKGKGRGLALLASLSNAQKSTEEKVAETAAATNSGSEYAWTKIGLFPQYGAKPEYFFALGVLCAKAVAMNSVLPIPFSVEFFKLIKGEHLRMEDVDSTYAQSLKSHEGLVGLQFVLPGNEDVELVPGGKTKFVTMSNVDEYAKLIEDFVCGSKLQPIKQSFCDGFNTVFQRGMWNLLEARELRTLIAGEEVKITMKDLTNFVEISHGYESNSPQIKMLFDLIIEFNDNEKSLFVKFITGSERLPIGGLASLQPQLAVAKKIDDSMENQDDALPSVMTCTHYFKLPPYSTKEIMREKILLAITEGQGAFLLT